LNLAYILPRSGCEFRRSDRSSVDAQQPALLRKPLVREKADMQATLRYFPGLLGVALAPFVALLAAAAASAADWPQFLGPSRTGLSQETQLIESFPADGPQVAWRKTGGVGMSGVAIAEGLVCTLVQRDGKQWAVGLDALTGEQRWATPLAAAYENSMGDGPRSTPTIANGVVCTYTGEGILTALKAADGSPLWSCHPAVDLGGKPAEYGMACSPLVHTGLVIVIAGAPQATLAAYDLQNGELRWKAGMGVAAGYSSPTLLTLNSRPQVVAFTGGSVLGVDPATGDALWQHPWETDYNCNIAVPLEIDGQVLISCGENHGSALLSIRADGNVSERWTSNGVDSVLRNEWQTSLLVNGVLYGFDNVGSAGPVTHYTCINPITGERRWQQKRFGKGNAIAADGKLWCSTMEGELVLLRADPDEFVELGRAKVLETTRQAPSLANGRLYLRDGEQIICLDVRAAQ
jgi:outer membrane protein assembly factor BamB